VSGSAGAVAELAVAQRVLWLSLVSGSAGAVAELAVAQRVLWLSLL